MAKEKLKSFQGELFIIFFSVRERIILQIIYFRIIGDDDWVNEYLGGNEKQTSLT